MTKILIIGGTRFIGRNLIEKLGNNEKYELTLFNRGVSNPDLFPNIKRIVGDRNSDDVKLIHDIQWDYVIDLSCYFPQSLIDILSGLNVDLKKYVFISTCSVYEEYKVRNGTEKDKVKSCNIDQFYDQSTDSYGNRKAECERILKASKVNFTILRPDLVYGKYDPTDRFYYWLHQSKKYDQILVPENGKPIFSLTYVQDLVDTIMQTLNDKLDRDAYNITTVTQTSIGQILDYSLEIMGTEPKRINASSEFLKKNNINEWTDMPVWIDGDYSVFENKKVTKNFDIKFTDFKTTVQDTILYFDLLGWPNPSYGMSRERQLNLLDTLSK